MNPRHVSAPDTESAAHHEPLSTLQVAACPLCSNWVETSGLPEYSRFSIVQYFVVLGVVLNDTEYCSVLFNIFSA
jgi:hypothetical protein